VTFPKSNSADTSRNANISFLFFALGGAVGLINMVSATIPFGEGFEMVALAKNLAVHGAYVNPFRVLDTGATLKLLPHRHGCDGFFAAVLERI
jgi:hypothetical protein